MAGLSTTGLTIKRQTDLKADLETGLRAELGSGLEVGPDSVVGHLIAALVGPLGELWELAQGLHDAFDPASAQGRALDNLASLVGLTREGATRASGTVTLAGEAGTVVPAGKLIATEGRTFLTLASVTIPVGGVIEVGVQAEAPGALSVAGGASWQVVTPVSGWSGVSNAASFTPGRDAESDEALRLRREESLQVVGAATDASLRGKVLALEQVIAARVVSNRSMTPSASGQPAKSFHVVVHPAGLSDAQEAELARVIWETAPAGIEAHGAVQYQLTDAQGYTQTVGWSYATALTVYVEVDLVVADDFPADGRAQVGARVEGYFEGLSIGDDVRVGKVLCAVLGVAGVVEAVVRLGTVSPPMGTVSIPVADDQIAQLAAFDPEADIEVVEE